MERGISIVLCIVFHSTLKNIGTGVVNSAACASAAVIKELDVQWRHRKKEVSILRAQGYVPDMTTRIYYENPSWI